MNKTKIDWVRNPDGTPGYTWNPITGCLNHVNGMCKGGNFPCYAYRLATTRLRESYRFNPNVAPEIRDKDKPWELKALLTRNNDPFYPRFWPDRLNDRMPPVARVQSYERYGMPCSETFAYRKYNYKPKGIFVCDMSDLFGIGIPEEWTRKVLGVIKANPKDRFYLLTKQPQNLAKFSPFPDNCWVGVTATNRDMLEEATIYLANDVKAKIKYISMEPFLGWSSDVFKEYWLKGRINWIIIGAQTKPTVMPERIWIDEITDACKKAGIPYFLKNNLIPLIGEELVQDMPK